MKARESGYPREVGNAERDRSTQEASYGQHPFKPDEAPQVTFEIVRLRGPLAEELAAEQARVISEVIKWLAQNARKD